MVWDGTNWRTNPYYNTNTTPYGIRVYRDTVSESAFNNDYPLLISRSLASAIASTYSNNVYGVINNTDATKIPTYNLYTGELKAPSFKGNLTGDVTGNASTVGNKSVSTTAPSSSSTDSVFPTSKAVWSAISNASGYGCTGTVTSITLKAGAGITLNVDDTEITTSGSRTISITDLDTTSGDTSKWLN